MLSMLKEMLKKNRITRALARRTRSLFSPMHHLQDLRYAWNYQFYAGNDLEHCVDLFRKNVDYQAKLAAQRLRPTTKRYLGPEWVCNIGTLAHLDAYVKLGLLGWQPAHESVLTAYPGEIGNDFFLRMWGKYFAIMDDPETLRKHDEEIQLLMDYHLVLDVKGKLIVFQHAAAIVQREWETQGRGPLLQLDEATKERGRQRLVELGVPRDAWFVPMHVRENGFKADEHRRCVRNADAASYLPAIRKIAEQGGYVIRCGDPKMTPLPATKGLVDYAFSPLRADWMDIFLASQSRFLIGTQSGLSHVADVFGVPTLYTNWISWGYPPWYGTNLFVPKTLWDRRQGREVGVRELLQSGLGYCQNPEGFDGRDIEIRNSTPEELEAGVEQMLAETRPGAWKGRTAGDPVEKVLSEAGIVLNSRVSDAFLAKHATKLGLR